MAKLQYREPLEAPRSRVDAANHLVTLAEIGLRFDAVKGIARHDTLFTEPRALVWTPAHMSRRH